MREIRFPNSYKLEGVFPEPTAPAISVACHMDADGELSIRIYEEGDEPFEHDSVTSTLTLYDLVKGCMYWESHLECNGSEDSKLFAAKKASRYLRHLANAIEEEAILLYKGEKNGTN